MEERSFDHPFYKEISRYAARFARPVFLGESPAFSDSAPIASATMTLLKFDDLFIGVTCQHVLSRYREMQETSANIVFQIGQARFNALQNLIQEDRDRDLATFNLTPFVGKVERMDESSFIEPPCWPPSDVSEDDVICLAGFPGIWREQPSLGHLDFYSFGSGATQVYAVGEEKFVIRIEPGKGIVVIDRGKVLGSLGGLSGGPVFCWRTGVLLRAELVGFIFEYQESLDLMYVRAARVLNRDGTFTI